MVDGCVCSGLGGVMEVGCIGCWEALVESLLCCVLGVMVVCWRRLDNAVVLVCGGLDLGGWILLDLIIVLCIGRGSCRRIRRVGVIGW